MTLSFRIFFLASNLWVFTSLGGAQQLESSFHTRVTPAQHGGIYHVASGTWTRNVPHALALGQDIIYNNTAVTGGFTSGGIANQTASFAFVDAGRIPTTTSPTPGVNRDSYLVNSIEISYCVDDDSMAMGPLNVDVQLYNLYSTCLDPETALNVGGVLGMGLPNYDPIATMPGYFDCWVVELDLSGGQEICLKGDGDGFYSGAYPNDQFGIGLEFDPGGIGGYVGAITVGPVLAGDPEWTVSAAGGYNGAMAGGGDTYYGPAETCVPTGGGLNSTGFDVEDAWWQGDRPATGQPAGCYSFGGASNQNGCAANGTQPGHVPHAGMYAVLRADASNICVEVTPSNVGTPFCDPAQTNTSGAAATLLGMRRLSAAGDLLHLEVLGGPPGEFGFLILSAATAPSIPISQGNLCLSLAAPNQLGYYRSGVETNSIGRFSPAGQWMNLAGNGNGTLGTGYILPDANPIPGQPPIMAGSTWHFQVWYRDTPFGVGNSNMSTGLSVTF